MDIENFKMSQMDSFLEFVEKELISSRFGNDKHYFVSEKLIIDGFFLNFDEMDGQDLTLLVSCKHSDKIRVLNVHSIILKSKSNFFNCYLSSRWNKEKKVDIRLPLSNCLNYFENIIHYLYGSDLRLDKNNVWVYYCLADYCLIPSLKSLCLQFWLKFLDRNNKFSYEMSKMDAKGSYRDYLSDKEIINLIQFMENPLKYHAAKSLMARYGILLKKKKLLNSQLRTLPGEVFALMLSAPNEFLNEEELLKLALYWLTLQFKTKKLSKTIVENILSKIRYDLLSKECLKKLSENPSIKYHFTRSNVLKNCLIKACLRKIKLADIP